MKYWEVVYYAGSREPKLERFYNLDAARQRWMEIENDPSVSGLNMLEIKVLAGYGA